MDCSTPGPPVHHQLLELTQTHVHQVGDAVQPSHPIFHSIRVFSKESVLLIRWPKYWSFSFSICPSNEYSGLISSRIDWFDLLAVQGTLKSSPTPQFESIDSVLSLLYGPALTSIHDYWRSHSFDYTDLCWQSDISAFNILSRFVIAFLPKSKHLLISWLQSLSVGGFEPKKIKSVIISTFSPSICHEVMEPDRSFLNDGFQGSCFTLFFHPYQGDPW